MSRTHETDLQYAERSRALVARFVAETGQPFKAEPFAVWLASLRPTLAPSTWRMYRLAGCRALEGMPFESLALPLIDVAPAPRPAKKGSSLKAKRMPLRDHDRLLALLALSRSDRSRSLADWIRAGCATGLRPCEWAACRLDGSALLVETAKSTNGRGNGGIRTLDLSLASGDDLRAVARMAERGANWRDDGRYEIEQEAHAQLLRQTVRRAFGADGPRYSLYSTRHQAIANAKAVHSRETVAALAGHGSVLTAARSYGRRRSAWAPGTSMSPIPSMTDVATVRSRSQGSGFDVGTVRP